MVTSRIPAYSLNSEFNREFRSFRITRGTPRSTLYAPAIVPIHEYPRVSVHERREALKAALSKAWCPKQGEDTSPATYHSWAASNQTARHAATPHDLATKPPHYTNGQSKDVSRVTLVKNEFESKDVPRRSADANDDRIGTNGDYCHINGDGSVTRLHSKDVNYSDYINNVPKSKPSFENYILKQSHDDRYNGYTDKRNGYNSSTKRQTTFEERRHDVNSNNVEHNGTNGDTYESVKYGRTAPFKSYGKADTVKSKLLSIDSPKSVTLYSEKLSNGYNGLNAEKNGLGGKEPQRSLTNGSKALMETMHSEKLSNGYNGLNGEKNGSGGKEPQRPLTSGPKALVEARLAERLEVKAAELPALYLGVDSWTPKSNTFQKSMRDHEWSVSYVPHPIISMDI